MMATNPRVNTNGISTMLLLFRFCVGVLAVCACAITADAQTPCTIKPPEHFKAECIFRYHGVTLSDNAYVAVGLDTLSKTWYYVSTNRDSDILERNVRERFPPGEKTSEKFESVFASPQVSLRVFPQHFLRLICDWGAIESVENLESGETLIKAAVAPKAWDTFPYTDQSATSYELRIAQNGRIVAYRIGSNAEWQSRADLHSGEVVQVSQPGLNNDYELVEYKAGTPGTGFRRDEVLNLRDELTTSLGKENYESAKGNIHEKLARPTPDELPIAKQLTPYKPPTYSTFRWPLFFGGITLATGAILYRVHNRPQ